jgi:hypothetical protein
VVDNHTFLLENVTGILALEVRAAFTRINAVRPANLAKNPRTLVKMCKEFLQNHDTNRSSETVSPPFCVIRDSTHVPGARKNEVKISSFTLSEGFPKNFRD